MDNSNIHTHNLVWEFSRLVRCAFDFMKTWSLVHREKSNCTLPAWKSIKEYTAGKMKLLTRKFGLKSFKYIKCDKKKNSKRLAFEPIHYKRIWRFSTQLAEYSVICDFHPCFPLFTTHVPVEGTAAWATHSHCVFPLHLEICLLFAPMCTQTCKK